MFLTPIQQIAVAGLMKNTADRVNEAAASLARIEEQNKKTLERIEQQNREIQASQPPIKRKYEWRTTPPKSQSPSDSLFGEWECFKPKKKEQG